MRSSLRIDALYRIEEVVQTETERVDQVACPGQIVPARLARFLGHTLRALQLQVVRVLAVAQQLKVIGE